MKGTCSLLGQYIDIISGAAFKSDNFLDDPSHVPLIKGENIGQGTILWEKSKYWPKDKTEEYIRYFLEPGDIVLAMDRPWVNAGLKYAVISEKNFKSLLVQRVARLRAKKGLIQQFLRYIVSSLDFSKYIKSCMRGTNIPHISADQIRNFRCQIPPIDVQKGIINILSSYDDLIENNRRRIQLLEKTARTLYNEWFVRLRFPGHEHVKVVDGVPEGWERTTLGEVSAYISRGITPSYDDSAHGLVINQKCVRNHFVNTSLGRYQAKPVPQIKLLLYGDVLINSTGTGTLGRVAQYFDNIENCTVDSHVTIARPLSKGYMTYYGYTILSNEEILVKAGRGSTNQTELARSVIEEIQFIKPSVTLLSQFEEYVMSIKQQIQILLSQNRKLAQARDLLLPKLMSGEVTV